MIRAVFFDYYDTVVTFDPPREELQVRACQEFGIDLDRSAIPYAYWIADDYLTRENAHFPLKNRSPEELINFWTEYERIILREVGIEVSLEQGFNVVTRLRQLDRDHKLFDDVIPALKLLKSRGIASGIISNLQRSIDSDCNKLGLNSYIDFTLTSSEVGSEKPHAPIFLAALEKVGSDASEAIHVGDQYNSDVIGARAVGIKPLLLDRNGFWNYITDCQKIRGLEEIINYL